MRKTVMIHKSGNDEDTLRIFSHGNGCTYSVYFGEVGSPMHNLWFQDQDATALHNEFINMETANPSMATRDVWLAVLDSYL